MKTRVFTLLTAISLLSISAFLAVGTSAKTNVKRAKANQLVTLLPASDGVVTVDVKRFFAEAMPTLLASNQPMLADIMGKIDQVQAATGLDVRKFDLLATGVSAKPIENGKYDVDFVVVARGEVTSSSLISIAKRSAADKYKEETVGGKQMLIFSLRDLAAAKVADHAKAGDVVRKVPSEMALAAIDANTVAFGVVGKVRQALQGGSKVGSDVTELLNRKEFAAVNMAGKLPAGMKTFLPLEMDALGKNLDSIRYVWGSFDVAAGQMAMSMTARTEQIANAKELYETLDVMKTFGKAALSTSKRDDQQLYARLIDKVEFSRSGTEISVDLRIPQADLDQLMGILAKKK